MKKIIFLSTIISMMIFTSCDYLSNFEDLEELTANKETTTYEYTIVDSDFTTMANALNANKNSADSILATALGAAKMFSNQIPASEIIPYLLKSKFYGANKNSAAKISYKFRNGTMGYYSLSTADYFAIWNIENIKALTNQKSATVNLPNILSTRFNTAKEGDIKVVEYQFSDSEPTNQTSEVIAYSEDFESYNAGSGIAVPTTSFKVNKDTKGTIFWQNRLFNNNKYAQVSANNSGSENEVWLITPQVNLSSATDNAAFTFDVNVGYYNANCLTVLVSENFDGTETGIVTANWVDVTSSFIIPQTPASGYGTLATAGTMNFATYAGKKVYIAFKYTGNGNANNPPLQTTTFQIDNIKVSYNAVTTTVPASTTKFAYYKYEAGLWTNYSTKTFYQLIPEDYTEIGLSTLSLTNASNYIPTLLKQKYPYAQNGATRIVVFKTSNTQNNADEYILKNGEWEPVSLIETKTDQFVFSGWDEAGWVFDPTIRVTMKKGTANTDDYMLVVNYVKEKYGQETPALLGYYNSNLQTEYYYGFAAFYGNISLRVSDRLKDPTFAALTTDEEKAAYLKSRTEEGLAIYLSLKFPETPLNISGIDINCFVITAIYDGVTTSSYEYKFKRVNTDLKWEYVEHRKL